VPEIALDTVAVARDWRAAYEGITAVLHAKQAARLERMTLAGGVHAAAEAYEAHRLTIAALSGALQRANDAIRLVKEEAAVGNPTAIAADPKVSRR